MPNWCYNTLTIYSNDKSKLKKFFNENKTDESYLSYEKSVPITNKSCDVFTHNDTWGCKWNASDVDYSLDDNSLEYTFNSPWNYPDKWLDVVAKKYNDLIFELVTTYEDPGEDSTKVIYTNGEPEYYTKQWTKVSN